MQVFENTGVNILTDLPLMSHCQTVVDAINVTEEVFEHPVPVAFHAGKVLSSGVQNSTF